MCIRDREITIDLEKGKHLIVRYVATSDVHDDGTRTVFFEPVSYTHLRAHETVLDLVCRLLLEKKKHRVTNATFITQDLTKQMTPVYYRQIQPAQQVYITYK